MIEDFRPSVRLLVVDDEPAALAVIPETLRDGLEDLGWTDVVIDVAESGEQALEIASDGPLDLLVADVVMPGIDGIETYARLKERFPHLSCVVMTAHAPQHVTPIRALREGAADYVPKPIDPEYLVTTCHRQLTLGCLRTSLDSHRVLIEAVLASVDTGVLAIQGGRILCVNDRAKALLGEDEQTMMERVGMLNDAPLVPGHSNDAGTRVHQWQVDHDDGQTQLFHVVSSPMLDGNGARNGDVVVFRDVTHFAAQKQSESFKQMAAIAAHEMKNSVTGLRLITQHLTAQLETGTVEVASSKRMASIILDSVERLDRFARSFLGFSRIPDPMPVSVPAQDLVQEALSIYGQQTGLPDWVELKTEFAENLPHVAADCDLMFQVLQNLVLNAVEAMESAGEGTLTLTTGQSPADESQVTIAVQDTGPGVPPDMLKSIFEPNVTTREAGTGLGLVIVKEIVRKHAGQITLRSEPGQGACFTVSLPAVDKTTEGMAP